METNLLPGMHEEQRHDELRAHALIIIYFGTSYMNGSLVVTIAPGRDLHVHIRIIRSMLQLLYMPQLGWPSRPSCSFLLPTARCMLTAAQVQQQSTIYYMIQSREYNPAHCSKTECCIIQLLLLLLHCCTKRDLLCSPPFQLLYKQQAAGYTAAVRLLEYRRSCCCTALPVQQ